jgi:glycosyltransferase involved in cell wall biosynthesis
MSLTVLSVAFPFAAVGPACVGGAEQILGELDRALVAAGQISIVLARDGSQSAGKLIAISGPQPEILDARVQSAGRARVQHAIDRALAAYPVDLVHMHCMDFHAYTLPASLPVLVTLHLPVSWYPSEVWTRFPHYRFCFVSQSQRRTCPLELANSCIIENGVPIPPKLAELPRGDYALVLGRICPEKNAHEALEAGSRAGIPVWLAGQVFPYPAHLDYFRRKIEPLLRERRDGVRHRFLGPVGPEERNRLLAGARCLLHPTLAPETSSLAAMEALASGTPVVAYPSGALPEIVDQGITGFLVRNMDEMAAALARVATLSAGACRRAAQQRFDSRRMVRRYFDEYESLVRAAHAGAAQPEVLHA